MKIHLTSDEMVRLAKADNGVELVTTVESIIAGRMAKRHRASPLSKTEGNIRILQVRVTEKLFRKIERSRERRDVSMSAAARDLIELGLAASDKKCTCTAQGGTWQAQCPKHTPTADTEESDRG